MSYDTYVDNVLRGAVYTDFNILKRADDDGSTIAHVMAFVGVRITEDAVLRLVDNNGWSVAHEMAHRGHRFDSEDIQKLTTRDGVSVMDIMRIVSRKQKWEKDLITRCRS